MRPPDFLDAKTNSVARPARPALGGTSAAILETQTFEYPPCPLRRGNRKSRLRGSCISGKLSANDGFYIAMFDYQRVYIYVCIYICIYIYVYIYMYIYMCIYIYVCIYIIYYVLFRSITWFVFLFKANHLILKITRVSMWVRVCLRTYHRTVEYT